MSQRLENLRQKPEHHRRRVAAMTSSGVMVVIVAIWITTFPARFPQLAGSGVGNAASILNNSSEPDAPVDSLKNNVANSYTSMTNALNALGQGDLKTVSSVSNGVVISDTASTSTLIVQDPNGIQVVQ